MTSELDLPDFLDRKKNGITAEPLPAQVVARTEGKIVMPESKAVKKAEVKALKKQFQTKDDKKVQAVVSAGIKEKIEASKAKKPAKATKPKPAPAAKPTAGATKRDKIIAMLKRKEGASVGEMQKAHPLKGKTPLATYSAMVSVLKREFKIERVGEGKGEDRRYRIKA